MLGHDNRGVENSWPTAIVVIGGLLLAIGAILLLARPERNAGDHSTNDSRVPAPTRLASNVQVETARSTPIQPTALPVVSPTYVPTSAPGATIAATPPVPAVVSSIPAQTATGAPLRLSSGSRIQVIYEGAEGLNLRDGPNQGKVATLHKGSSLTVRGEAVDADGFRWWPVAIESGWIAEGPRDSTQPRWLTPLLTATITVSQPIQVAYTGTDGLNLRQAPGPGNETIATLLYGSTASVIGASQTIDGVTWWPVQIAAGWLSEGSTDVRRPRWIAPVTP